MHIYFHSLFCSYLANNSDHNCIYNIYLFTAVIPKKRKKKKQKLYLLTVSCNQVKPPEDGIKDH